MEQYFHVDPMTKEIIAGPFTAMDVYVKKLTSCGNPDLLPLAEYNLLPATFAPASANEKYGPPSVVNDKVVYQAIPLSSEEQAAKDAQYLETQKQIIYDDIIQIAGHLFALVYDPSKPAIELLAVPDINKPFIAKVIETRETLLSQLSHIETLQNLQAFDHLTAWTEIKL
jgi:hypothetical protein